MKHTFSLLAALVLALAGLASAQDYADNSDGGNEAVLSDTVEIDIPNRVALHMDSTDFSLDLASLSEDDSCYMVRKENIANFGDFDEFAGAISEYEVTNYPAAVFDGDGNVVEDADGYLKGGLVCRNDRVVQKFSNYLLGWELSADVQIPATSGIKFGIVDLVEGDPAWVSDGDTTTCTGLELFGFCLGVLDLAEYNRHYVPASTFGLELDDSTVAQQRLGRTNGWLDDYISEYFYFDGSEVAGDHDVSITYTLTGGL